MKIRASLSALLCAVVVGLPAAASAEDPAPELTLSTNRTTYAAGMTATITVKVRNGNNGDLGVAAYANGKGYVLQCGASGVNDATFKCQVAVGINTRFVAAIGDVTASKQVFVHPSMATYPGKVRYYQGAKALYLVGDEPPFATSVYPARKGMCIHHEVQVKRASGWQRVVLGGCKYTNKSGVVGWRWYGKHAAGYQFRVRGTFTGDSLSVAGVGTWQYFTFVKQ